MVEIAELVERLIHFLKQPELMLIARMKIEGYTEIEIAEATTTPLRTVRRRVARIRETWRVSGLLGDPERPERPAR